MNLKERFSPYLTPRTAVLLALLGGLVYLVLAFLIAHNTPTLLDEGAYLTKGYWYVTGRYEMYADYGPWDNQMPLAFLIPGAVQAWLAVGLRAARYFNILLSLLLLAGIWLGTKRLSNVWWAAFVVWTMALNPITIQSYIYAATQILGAVMLAWALAFAFDPDRRFSQLAASAVLCALLVMTRITLVFVPVFILLYFVWRDGWRTAVRLAFIAAVAFITLNVLYWPGILDMWVRFLPITKIVPAAAQFQPPRGAENFWLVEADTISRLASFWYGVRFTFLPILAFVFGVLMLVARRIERQSWQFKTGVVFFGLFALLLWLHADASVSGTYCIFCFQGYLSFFAFLAPMLFAMLMHTGAEWRTGGARPTFTALAILLAIGLLTGWGFATRAFWIDTVISPLNVQRVFMLARIPTSSGLQRAFFVVRDANDLTDKTTLDFLMPFARQVGPAAIGLLAGLALVALVAILSWGLVRRGRPSLPYGQALMTALFIFGLILSPTPLMGLDYPVQRCGDVLAAQEAIGAGLRQHVPEGSLVFWGGFKSAAPLLYILDRADTYPSQVNGSYSFRLAGDDDELERYGFWSPTLRDRWLEEADILLLTQTNNKIDTIPDHWQLVAELPAQDLCGSEGPLYVYTNANRP
ncbi:MAG: hypothetical protein EPO32_06590 [Anaerolineae bacterium]|nr:MAG: hypothetical protein EPO32_06590 [Anaerolineae bacterium]